MFYSVYFQFCGAGAAEILVVFYSFFSGNLSLQFNCCQFNFSVRQNAKLFWFYFRFGFPLFFYEIEIIFPKFLFVKNYFLLIAVQQKARTEVKPKKGAEAEIKKFRSFQFF